MARIIQVAAMECAVPVGRCGMVKKCSWCDAKWGKAWMAYIVVVAVQEKNTIAKAFQLCPDCIKITQTNRGIHLSRIKPGEKMEEGNG